MIIITYMFLIGRNVVKYFFTFSVIDSFDWAGYLQLTSIVHSVPYSMHCSFIYLFLWHSKIC